MSTLYGVPTPQHRDMAAAEPPEDPAPEPLADHAGQVEHAGEAWAAAHE